MMYTAVNAHIDYILSSKYFTGIDECLQHNDDDDDDDCDDTRTVKARSARLLHHIIIIIAVLSQCNPILVGCIP